jgi:alginate O-acetyltransferase complex protein AlgI
MLFNSFEFALFLPIVFLLYWFVFNRNLRSQNILLLACSYFFYGWWDFHFLFLLMFSTLLDYYTGLKMSSTTSPLNRKFWFWISIGVNLGFLGFFKYYNFFIGSMSELLHTMGIHASPWTLQIILPVGISFYTFHGMSYVIDIYNNRITPTKNFVDYAVFVSFFPLLVAGPIERATHLLPQIQSRRKFDAAQAADGMRQILWGLFKKMVIADNCAVYANEMFSNSSGHSGGSLFLGAVFFAFQIYGDFSGYSDIAIGVARLFGIELLRNFAFPYFSRDIAEFWRRWHMSLTSWFRDYVYIPLGGSKGSRWSQIRNIFIIFLISGFWHGANWTFLVWGLINAVYFIPLLLMNKNRVNTDIAAQGRLLPSVKEIFQITGTFLLTTLAWIFFRAESVSDALKYLSGMLSKSLFSVSYSPPLLLCVLLILFIICEWLQREKRHGLQFTNIKMSTPLRWAVYYALVIAMLMYGGEQQEFIYFQF